MSLNVPCLDDKCGKIDELLAAKEKEVKLLKELKQTVIADAVTRGISHAEFASSQRVSRLRVLCALRVRITVVSFPPESPGCPRSPRGGILSAISHS